MTDLKASAESSFPTIVSVGAVAPMRWLSLGWRDLVTGPGLFYGVALVLMGWSLQAFLAARSCITLAPGLSAILAAS